MVPTILDRLESVHRALSDVVIPAIAADEPLAIEQAQLSLVQLRILMGQVEISALIENQETQAVDELERRLSGASSDDLPTANATSEAEHHLGVLADRRIATLAGIDQRIEDVFGTGDAQQIKEIEGALIAYQRARKPMEERWFGAAFAGK